MDEGQKVYADAKQSDSVVARRCLDDPVFARQLLVGHDHPAVRSALIADLEHARRVADDLNPQPLPPKHVWVLVERIWVDWRSLERSGLRRLVEHREA